MMAAVFPVGLKRMVTDHDGDPIDRRRMNDPKRVEQTHLGRDRTAQALVRHRPGNLVGGPARSRPAVEPPLGVDRDQPYQAEIGHHRTRAPAGRLKLHGYFTASRIVV